MKKNDQNRNYAPLNRNESLTGWLCLVRYKDTCTRNKAFYLTRSYSVFEVFWNCTDVRNEKKGIGFFLMCKIKEA